MMEGATKPRGTIKARARWPIVAACESGEPGWGVEGVATRERVLRGNKCATREQVCYAGTISNVSGPGRG